MRPRGLTSHIPVPVLFHAQFSTNLNCALAVPLPYQAESSAVVSKSSQLLSLSHMSHLTQVTIQVHQCLRTSSPSTALMSRSNVQVVSLSPGVFFPLFCEFSLRSLLGEACSELCDAE